ISAILLLLNQKWRTSINRFAEAMTLFAVACAAMFPLLHLGRPWLFYWLFPYPNIMNVQPQFRGPLVLDVFAGSTYFTVSLLFWFIRLIPDLPTLRYRALSGAGTFIYVMLAMCCSGSARHWKSYEMVYLLLAVLLTPLVFFQAEVGIRDWSVTGVQTCALPIFVWHDLLLEMACHGSRSFRRHSVSVAPFAPVARPVFSLHRIESRRAFNRAFCGIAATAAL